MRLRIISLLLLVFALWSPAAADADEGGVDVVVVNGPMDGRLLEFVMDAIRDSDASLVILQVDVSAVLDENATELLALLADPPVPVAVWVGPAPAVAHGLAALLPSIAELGGAAPGTEIGWASPLVAGGGDDAERIRGIDPDIPESVIGGRIEVTGPVVGLIDIVQPSIGQFVVALDGMTIPIGDGTVTLSTATHELVAGVDTVSPSGNVRFIEPGLIDRTLRLGVRPETAFFFLVIGFALAVFEFYSAGPGVAAVVALICLMIAGYGIAVLPIWWPAVAGVLAGLGLYVVEFQRNGLGWMSIVGTLLIGFGGLRFVDASPQMVPVWWIVLLVVAGNALFFAFAMTTMVRARFSTQTIGREHLVGRTGTAVGAIAPDGLVTVDGATWRARSARMSGIVAGDTVVVTGVDLTTLQVDKPDA
ncbi:MAG TPA: NfeD family protein [Acidimicrobiia bacterium]